MVDRPSDPGDQNPWTKHELFHDVGHLDDPISLAAEADGWRRVALAGLGAGTAILIILVAALFAVSILVGVLGCTVLVAMCVGVWVKWRSRIRASLSTWNGTRRS